MSRYHARPNIDTFLARNLPFHSHVRQWIHPFMISLNIHCSKHEIDDISPEGWTQHAWRERWENSNYQLNNFIAYPRSNPPGYDLKRIQWVLLNRLQFGHGRYASFMHRVGLRENANCICGAIQTPQLILTCPIIGIKGDLKTVDEDFRNC